MKTEGTRLYYSYVILIPRQICYFLLVGFEQFKILKFKPIL